MSEEFFLRDLITERPDPTLDFWENMCPLCKSTEVTDDEGVITTLVGWFSPETEGLSKTEVTVHPSNPNHAGRGLICRDCGLHFVKEVKGGNVWVSACVGNHLLAGVPNCFEAYTYTCRHCGGMVRRRYTNLDGEKPAGGLSRNWVDGHWERLYRTFFYCTSCGAELEVGQDYYHE